MLGVYFFRKNIEIDLTALGLDEIDEKLYIKTQKSDFQTDSKFIQINGKVHKDSSSGSYPPTEKQVYDKINKSTNNAKNLDGIFSILCYEKNENKFTIINNRYTCHKVYYYKCEEYLAFSSSMASLLKYFIKTPKPHLGSIRSFISNGFTLCDQTQVCGVKKLLPTFSLEIHNEKLNLHNTWNDEISFNREKSINVKEKIEEYTKKYQEGIENFLKANDHKKIGTLLSGGNDTSFVLANLKQVSDKKINAYTTTFPGWAWNEESYAKNISQKFDAKFNPIPFDSKDLDLIIDLIKTCEEPVVGSSLPLHMIAIKASDEVDVMFGGDGGDTLWGEYYPVAEYHKYVKHLPLFIRKLIHQFSKVLVKVTDWERFWEFQHVSKLFIKDNYYKDFMRSLCTYRHFDEDFQKKLFDENFYNEAKVPESALEIKFTKDNFSDALIEGKLFNAFYTYQSFHTYKSMEGKNLPLYFPTIQKDVIDVITNLPNKWVNGGTTFHRLTNHKSINRRLHKKALSKYLRQDEIYNRSFDIPWYNILKPRTKVLELLERKLILRGWFKPKTIKSLFNDFKKQKVKDHELLELKHHGYRIFTLLSLEVWNILFIDNKFSHKELESISLEELLT
jgi:asparagine synthase (glutamine-hydrolysing)